MTAQLVGMLPLLLNDSKNHLPAPVSGVQPLVGLAYLFQRQHLGDEGTYLATLDERAHLFQSCSLSSEKHAMEGLVVLVEWREVALRAEDGRQATEGLRSRDALNDRPATHGI